MVLFAIGAAESAPAQLTVDRNAVAVSVLTDGKTVVTVRAQVNVASATDIKGLVLDAQALTGLGGLVINHSNIKLAAGTVNLVDGTKVPVVVSIGALLQQGRYNGSFVLRTGKPGSSVSVNLTVDVASKPVAVLGADGLAGYTCSAVLDEVS